MFERILVPLDGSRLAERIIPQVTRIAKQTGAEVILFQAFTPRARPAMEYYPTDTYGQPEADEYIAGKVEDLRLQGLNVRGFAGMGSAAHTILDVAKEEKATLIAMATHGRTGLARWALGSVAEKVIRASQVPVMVFRSFPGNPATDAERPIRNILLPLDGSERAKAITRPVAEMARHFDAKVIALHVMEPGEDRHAVSDSVQAVTARLVAEGAEGGFLIREGDAATEILETCADQQIDLVAMTTHGHTGPTRWVFGSVTEKVLRGACTPMLIVRAPMIFGGSTVRAPVESAASQ